MKIGTFIILETKDIETNQMQKYKCKVVEKNEKHLFVDYPINQNTKQTGFFPLHTTFSATYIGGDQSVYRFKTRINEKVKLPVPALALEYPKKENIQRIQRREYVRIKTAVDVAVHSKKNHFDSFTTVTKDISGGGLSIILPYGVTIGAEDVLDTYIVLHMDSKKYLYIHAHAEVIRINDNKSSASTASIKFTSITKQSQQNIIRYCFEKQREARQKQLL